MRLDADSAFIQGIASKPGSGNGVASNGVSAQAEFVDKLSRAGVGLSRGDSEARAVKQLSTFDAAVQFSKAEGIIPAPESAHAIRVAIDEALKCRTSGEKKVIAFNLSGHGHFDMMAYEAYHQGKLEDFEYPDALVQEAMTHLPKVPA